MRKVFRQGAKEGRFEGPLERSVGWYLGEEEEKSKDFALRAVSASPAKSW